MGGLHIINGTMQSTTNRCTDAALTCATFGSRKAHLQLWVLAGPAHTCTVHEAPVQGAGDAGQEEDLLLHALLHSFFDSRGGVHTAVLTALQEEGPACALHRHSLGQA